MVYQSTSVTPVEELCGVLRAASKGWRLHPGDVIIANGSRFEGLGNAQSDVDAWVILSDETHPREVPVFDWRDGLHLNMSSYSRAMVEQLAQSLNRLSCTDSESVAALPVNTLDRYYRVCSAVPVINPTDFQSQRAAFSRQHLAGLLATWTGLRAVIELDKAWHALGAGRAEQALLCARRAAESAIDHLLAKRGEVYPSLKWRFEKLARCTGAESPEYGEAWSLKAPGDRDPLAYLRLVEAYASRAGALRYPLVASRLRRAPSTELFTLAGRGYLVQGKTVLFELSDTARWLWDRMDGTRTEDELLAEFATAFPTLTGRRTGAAAFLARAIDLGLAGFTTDTLF